MPTLRNSYLAIACFYVLYRTSATLIRRYFVAKLTAFNELSAIGTKSSKPIEKLRGTVVICGGSISGLLTAKVCSEHFENVIIVESEEWVTTPEGYAGSHREGPAARKRSHVAQYRAIHSLRPFLIQAVMRWFPNLSEEAKKMGAQLVPQDWVGLTISGIPLLPILDLSDPNHGFYALPITRAGFETLLRRLVMNSCPNVRYMAGTATGLEQSNGSKAITGVHVRNLEKEEITLPAILAVDCTGASSAGLRWLRDLATKTGDEKALKQLDNIRLTYDPRLISYTCEFDIPQDLIPRLLELGFLSDWNAKFSIYSVYPDPKMDHNILFISRSDHNHLEILCGAWGDIETISSIGDIRSFILKIKTYKPVPAWVFKMLDLLEEYNVPFSSIDTSRLGLATYIQYSRYDNLPSNFVAIGDSVLRVNSSGGTGCSKACIDALTLKTILNKCHRQKGSQTDQLPRDFSKKFHKLQASRTGSAWEQFKVDDYKRAPVIPSKGEDPKTYKNFQKALGRLMTQGILVDQEFTFVLGAVQDFFAPPTDLFSPRMLWKLFKLKFISRSLIL